MEDKVLIEKVVDAYDQARKLEESLLNSDCKTKVTRKKNRAASAFLEDAFAVYVGDILDNERYSIWIDQTFKAEKKQIQALAKNRTFNPDLTIIKDEVIIGFIEVKALPQTMGVATIYSASKK